MKVNYLKNFVEDKRHSMIEYANDLIYYQKKNVKNFKVNYYNPKLHNYHQFLPTIWRMRIARYFDYPRLVNKLPNYDVTHILDHSYAHLVKKINSKVKILTVNDLIPLIFENKLSNKNYLFRYSLKHFKYFDKIIAISENTKKDILKYTDVDKNKIEVIYTNIPNKKRKKKNKKSKILKKFKLPLKSKKILISGDGFYKNHKTSIKVFEEILKKDKNVDLIWIGCQINIQNIINKDLLKKIFIIPPINKDEIYDIYRVCDVVLFISLYEGMGIVPLEAMMSKVPVITSNRSSLPEIVGKRGNIFNPYDVKRITKEIVKLFKNKRYYAQKVKLGSKQFDKFNYHQMHKKIINVYREELNKKNMIKFS